MVKLKLRERELYAEISEDVLVWMQNEAVSAFPNETGGFLFGHYSDDMQVVYIEKAVHPILSHGTNISFDRCVHFAQFAEMYKNNMIYLGEWHSHPNGRAEYSGRDMQSMIEIAEYETTLIRHPLLVIIGVTRKRMREYNVYMYDQKRLVRYE